MLILCTACGEAPIHDTSTKENTHTADLSSAHAAETGSTTTLSGKYQIEGTQNTFCVITSNQLSLVESGEYSFAGDQITIQYGNNSPVTYTIEEVESGFNLVVPEDSILLSLEYMEGEDGLSNNKPDGIYEVDGRTGNECAYDSVRSAFFYLKYRII